MSRSHGAPDRDRTGIGIPDRQRLCQDLIERGVAQLKRADPVPSPISSPALTCWIRTLPAPALTP